MVKALRALPGETRRIRLRPWLYRIARNEAVEVLRRRRDSAELDPELVASADEPSETAAARERLRHLFADLGELPERQRSALVMRELAGLGFEEIAQAFDTSAAVARQAVYEARLGLRQMEAGREMRCRNVMWDLSEADGRVARRRDIQAHLRACPECRAFAEEIRGRRDDFAAIAPLPLAVSAGLLQGLLGGGAGAAGTAGAAAGTSVVAKAVATVAVAAVGVTAADRGGVIETPLPASIGGAKSSEPAPGTAVPSGDPGPAPENAVGGGSRADRGPNARRAGAGAAGDDSRGHAETTQVPLAKRDSIPGLASGDPPEARGRGVRSGDSPPAAAHKNQPGSRPPAGGGKGKGPASKATGKPVSPPKGPPAAAIAKPKAEPPSGQKPEVTPDKAASAPFQPSKPESKSASP
jgi:RNA polymerase sigma factor (sigma-70 family)